MSSHVFMCTKPDNFPLQHPTGPNMFGVLANVNWANGARRRRGIEASPPPEAPHHEPRLSHRPHVFAGGPWRNPCDISQLLLSTVLGACIGMARGNGVNQIMCRPEDLCANCSPA